MSASGPVLSSKALGGELARDMQLEKTDEEGEQRRTAEEMGQGRGRGKGKGAEHLYPHSVSLVKDGATHPSLRPQPCALAGCPGGRRSPSCHWVPSDLVNTCLVHYSWPCPLPGGAPTTLPAPSLTSGCGGLVQSAELRVWKGVTPPAHHILAMHPVP